jgi:hypothetical protein
LKQADEKAGTHRGQISNLFYRNWSRVHCFPSAYPKPERWEDIK